ncbi:MAG: hypothetical protein AB7G28_07535 [Pirellulales bacterium]
MNMLNRRNGLSVLEFIGCLMALVGGIWLGAIYLGIDLHRVAFLALTESKLMNQVPESWRPVTPESEQAPSHAQLAESVRNELAALRGEITSLRESQGAKDVATQSVAQVPPNASAPAASSNSAQPVTLEYWNRLAQIVQNNYTLQLGAESAATEGNATKVAAIKGRVSRLSATAIEALNTEKVDPALVTFGTDLATWYESGADLYDEAVRVWGASAGGQGNPQLAKEWQQANVQYENEGRLLRDRAKTLRETLTQELGVEFPPLSGL